MEQMMEKDVIVANDFFLILQEHDLGFIRMLALEIFCCLFSGSIDKNSIIHIHQSL
jgi:ABC-type uncharacterized transport system ATPase subunit